MYIILRMIDCLALQEAYHLLEHKEQLTSDSLLFQTIESASEYYAKLHSLSIEEARQFLTRINQSILNTFYHTTPTHRIMNSNKSMRLSILQLSGSSFIPLQSSPEVESEHSLSPLQLSDSLDSSPTEELTNRTLSTTPRHRISLSGLQPTLSTYVETNNPTTVPRSVLSSSLRLESTTRPLSDHPPKANSTGGLHLDTSFYDSFSMGWNEMDGQKSVDLGHLKSRLSDARSSDRYSASQYTPEVYETNTSKMTSSSPTHYTRSYCSSVSSVSENNPSHERHHSVSTVTTLTYQNNSSSVNNDNQSTSAPCLAPSRLATLPVDGHQSGYRYPLVFNPNKSNSE